MSETIEKACLDYLKAQGGADRLLELFKEKYRSLGTVGGSVVLHSPKPLEIELLRGLMKLDASGKKQVNVALKKFEQAFTGTRFDGVSLEKLLFLNFSEALVSKKDERENWLKTRAGHYMNLSGSFGSENLAKWLSQQVLPPSGAAYPLFVRLDQGDRAAVTSALIQLDKALGILAEMTNPVPLPLLASDTCLDPHAMDEGTVLEKLMTSYFTSAFERLSPQNAEERAELYFEAGIMTDLGSRLVLSYGLKAFKADGSSKGWEAFAVNREPLALNLVNLEQVEAVKPVWETSNTVFCCENPAVFYQCMRQYPEQAAVCTSGQINLAGYLLIELIVNSGVVVYYCGDYDPEGLLIADKLKVKFGERLQFLGYTEELCERALSEKDLSPRRLKQLDKLKSQELKPVAEVLCDVKRAGYQETVMTGLMVLVGQLG